MAEDISIPFARSALVLAALIALVSISVAVTRPVAPGPEAAEGDPITGITQAVESHPEDAEAWRMLGLARSAQGDYRAAAAAYGQALKRRPKDADIRSALGEAQVQAAAGKVTPSAAASFRAALALDPAEPRARYYLALARLQAGDRAGAVADLRKLLASAPADAAWRPVVQQALDRATR